MSNEYEYHHKGFGGARHGFNNTASERRSQSPPYSNYALSGVDYSMTLLPLQPAGYPNQKLAPHPRFPDNDDQAFKSMPGRMSIDKSYPSRKPSDMTGIQQTFPNVARDESQEYTCQCLVGNPMASSPLLQVHAEPAYDKIRPYTQIPVGTLLNNTHAPPFPPAASLSSMPQAQDAGLPAASSSANFNTHMHNADPSRSRTQSIYTSFTTSSRMLVPESQFHSHSQAQVRDALNVQRCFLLNTLYDICVGATLSYIRSLLPCSRHRARVARRWEPYPSRSSPKGKAPSLMDNISTISTHLWRKARHHAITPRRAEWDAVREMRDLYIWSEIVDRGMESDGLLDLEAEMEEGEIDDDGASESTFVGGEGMETPLRVGRAAKRICEWSGDGEAWDACQNAVDELRRLVKEEKGKGKEVRRGGWKVVEVLDEEGSIS